MVFYVMPLKELKRYFMNVRGNNTLSTTGRIASVRDTGNRAITMLLLCKDKTGLACRTVCNLGNTLDPTGESILSPEPNEFDGTVSSIKPVQTIEDVIECIMKYFFDFASKPTEHITYHPANNILAQLDYFKKQFMGEYPDILQSELCAFPIEDWCVIKLGNPLYHYTKAEYLMVVGLLISYNIKCYLSPDERKISILSTQLSNVKLLFKESGIKEDTFEVIDSIFE